VKPYFAVPLVEGTKPVEIRKVFGGQPGDSFILYSSTPQRLVLGELRIDVVRKLPVVDTWDLYGRATLLSEAELYQYAGNRTSLVAIEVSSPVRWPRPVPLSELRSIHNIEPAQSYRRIHSDVAERLRKSGTERVRHVDVGASL